MSDSPTQHKQQGLGSSIYVFLAEALIIPTGLITAIFLTRQLGPADYGLFTLTATFIAWIQWSITSAFARTTVQLVSSTDDWQPIGTTVIRLHLLVSTSTMVLIWLLATPIANLMNEPTLAAYLRLLALDLPLFSLAHGHRDILVGRGDFVPRALSAAGRWTTRLILILVLVSLGLSINGAILGSIGASIVQLAICRFYARPPVIRGTTVPLRQLWNIAVPLFLFALVMRFYDKVDLFALKILGGTTEEAGIYGATQNLALVPGIFALSFSPLLLSTLTRTLRAGAVADAHQLGRNAMRIVLLLIPFAGLVAGTAPELIQFIYGEAFAAAAPLLAILIFGALMLVMISVTTAIMTAAGKAAWTVRLAAPMLVCAIIGHIAIIPQFGLTGAATVTTICALIGALVAIIVVQRLWQILPPFTTLLRSILIYGVAYGLALLWSLPHALVLLELTLISLTIPLMFLLLGEFSSAEKSIIVSFLRRSLKRNQSQREVI